MTQWEYKILDARVRRVVSFYKDEWKTTETGSLASAECNQSNTQVHSIVAWFVSDTFPIFQVGITLNVSEQARYVKSVRGTPVKRETPKKFIHLFRVFLFEILVICGNTLFGLFRPFHKCFFKFYNQYSCVESVQQCRICPTASSVRKETTKSL